MFYGCKVTAIFRYGKIFLQKYFDVSGVLGYMCHKYPVCANVRLWILRFLYRTFRFFAYLFAQYFRVLDSEATQAFGTADEACASACEAAVARVVCIACIVEALLYALVSFANPTNLSYSRPPSFAMLSALLLRCSEFHIRFISCITEKRWAGATMHTLRW